MNQTSQTSKELKPSTRCNIFLVETANMANDHHTGFEVHVHVRIYIAAPLGTPQLEFSIQH